MVKKKVLPSALRVAGISAHIMGDRYDSELVSE